MDYRERKIYKLESEKYFVVDVESILNVRTLDDDFIFFSYRCNGNMLSVFGNNPNSVVIKYIPNKVELRKEKLERIING